MCCILGNGWGEELDWLRDKAIILRASDRARLCTTHNLMQGAVKMGKMLESNFQACGPVLLFGGDLYQLDPRSKSIEHCPGA